MILAFSSDIQTLDPHDHILRLGIITMYHLFDNLVVRNLDTGEIIPHLATSWNIIDDTTWEFKLRDDVVFHNGEKFTAQTVKFNYDRILNPDNNLPQRGNHKEIKSVEVVDDTTVRFTTHRPYPIMLERMQNFQMIPEGYFKEKGKAHIAEHPVGTGPYKFVHWIRGRELLFERNENYWGPKPALKYAKIRIIPDTSTQIAELLSGGIDIVRALPPDQIEVVNASGVARHMIAPILRTGFLQLDSVGRSGKHPVQNVKVRQALNHAVNIDGYIKYILNGNADRVATVINPKAFGYDPTIAPYEYDPDKARALLKEAGYPDGFELRFRTGLTTKVAVASYLALQINRIADYSSTICVWHTPKELVAHTFGRQSLPMVWDYVEVNCFGESSGDWKGGLDWIRRVCEHVGGVSRTSAIVKQTSATTLSLDSNSIDSIVTDPPYYDSVPYSDLSDFFYVWAKRTVSSLYPEVFRTPLTPKGQELIAYYGRGERRIQKLPA